MENNNSNNTNNNNNQNNQKIERIYNIHYRQVIKKAPRWRRAKKAITYVKEFLKRHMKVDEVKLSEEINREIWKNGAKNPPGRISVKVVKEGNVARVYLNK